MITRVCTTLMTTRVCHTCTTRVCHTCTTRVCTSPTPPGYVLLRHHPGMSPPCTTRVCHLPVPPGYICLPTPLWYIGLPTPPWVYPTLPWSSRTHCQCYSGPERQSPGLKRGERHGCYPRILIKVLKVLKVVYLPCADPLLSARRKGEGLDSDRVTSHPIPY